MRIPAFILFSAWLLASIFPSRAGTPSYSTFTWQAEDGLPDNRVVGLAQSPDGYLWVATQGGLVRFDGVHFHRIGSTENSSLVAGTLRVLFMDRRGRIWLAKEEGGTLFCIEKNQLRVLTPDGGAPKNETQSSMVVDGEGRLWIAYNTGKIIRYDEDGKVDDFSADAGLPGGAGSCWLASDRQGALWFAKGSHVGIFRDGKFEVLKNFASSETRIAAARENGVWICSGQQIFKFDEGSEPVELGKIVPENTGNRSSFNPSVVFQDRAGAVWVGTVSAGLFRCDSNAITKVNVSNPGILSLAEDREGDIWVGTRGGLNRLHRRAVSLIRSSDGLPFEGTQSVCQDATGALWVVGENGVLAKSEDKHWMIQSPAGDPGELHVTCVAADNAGSVWVGGWGGALYQWTNGSFRDLKLQNDFNKKSPRALLVAKNGGLWIGTDAPDVLFRLRAGKLRTFSLPAGHRFVRAMAEDAAGNFWAGASDGLLVRISGDTLTDETLKSKSISVRCLQAATNGDLWIGYAGAGVGRVRDGHFEHFGAEQGLPNDFIAQILTDNQGNVWFGSNQGIFRVSERDFEEVIAGTKKQVNPTVYGRSEGLAGLQASFDFCPSSLRASDGRLFFSMLSGLVEVQPESVSLNRLAPDVFIERVTADDQTFGVFQDVQVLPRTNTNAAAKSVAKKSEMHLPPGLQQVQFEFTALSFVAPENVRFRCKLEGLDKAWVDAGARRTISYTHPPPGRYQFKVIACNNDGVWNTTGDSLALIVEPYFWETLWFKTGVTLVSFAILCGAVVLELRRRHRRVVERLEHQRALELERTRIARDLHDDLGVGLTEIGLLGDLAGTNNEMPQTSRERLDEITGRARTLAASLDEIVWAINPANDTSQSLVDYFFPYAQKLLGRAGIRCRLEVVGALPPGTLNAEERHEFFHAFKEALNNVIRHSGARQAQITFSAAENRLMVRIADDGCGIKEIAGTGAHHGLTGMRERLQRLGGRCEISSNGEGGATVTFIIPVQPES
ncbi:MAG TPA: two-component regulator propeller domain-containing protein [Verrucomicrobiae bacterium]|nr:two-component regulator propeller domain-containing protein [Verrucomicrobiae bacterium]